MKKMKNEKKWKLKYCWIRAMYVSISCWRVRCMWYVISNQSHEVHVIVLRNLYPWYCMYPKFLDVDRISIAVVLKRKWITTYRFNLGVTIGLTNIEMRKYEAIHFSQLKSLDTKLRTWGQEVIHKQLLWAVLASNFW